MTGLNWVDVVLGVIILSFVGLGIYRGILREALSLAGLVFGIFAGLKSYEFIGFHIEGLIDIGTGVANLTAFLTVFSAIVGGFAYLGYLLKKAAKKLFIAWLDRSLGGVFGATKGLLIASVVSLTMALFPFTDKLENDLGDSVIGPFVVKVAPAMYGSVMTKIRGEDYEGMKFEEIIYDYAESSHNNDKSDENDIDDEEDNKEENDWNEIKKRIQ